jgi:hypothetical protein
MKIQYSPSESHWVERLSEIYSLCQAQRELNPKISIRKIAKIINLSRQTVCDCLMIYRHSQIEPEILVISSFRRAKAYVKGTRKSNVR